MSSRTFRLFVSSTFSDMLNERRILNEQVFPKLAELCSSRGAVFQPVDLRWGVNESSQLDHKTMYICLGEIERCQRLSPKPNFLVLLGDRYGWEPLPARIDAVEFEAITSDASEAAMTLLMKWYVLDENAVPSEYVLKGRGKEFADYDAWAPEERRILAVLRELVKTAELTDSEREKYFMSATHQEIARGALNLPALEGNTIDPAEHVLACFRTIEDLPQEPSDFFDDRGSQLKELRGQIQERLNRTDPVTENIYEYKAAWKDEERNIALKDEASFASRVLDHFTRIITLELDSLKELPPLEAEKQAHTLFRDHVCRNFSGQEELLDGVDEYLRGDGTQVLSLVGESGSGKSALLAKLATDLESASGVVVYRSIGVTPSSTILLSLLHGIEQELADKLNAESADPAGPQELEERSSQGSELEGVLKLVMGLFARATSELPVTLILDGLEDLSDPGDTKLFWLPEELPTYSKVVVSTLPRLQVKAGWGQCIELPPLTIEDGRRMLGSLQVEADRRLQPAQQEAVLSAFATSGSPLYLRIAFEEARSWQSGYVAPALPDDLRGIIESVLDSLEANHNPKKGSSKAPLVELALGLLASARHGLTETELLDLLSRDKDFFNAYEQATHYSLEEKRIPVTAWSRLYLDLEPYLVERVAQGLTALTFRNRMIGDIVRARQVDYDSGQKPHRLIAEYFSDQEKFLDEKRAQPNGRKLAELPYQLLKSESWSDLLGHLTDFDTLMATCQAGLHEQLVSDYRGAAPLLLANGFSSISPWASFFRENAHVLRFGDEDWPSNRILLQFALECGEGRVVSSAAKEWLRSRPAPWLMLRSNAMGVGEPEVRLWRIDHGESVEGVVVGKDDSIICWGEKTCREFLNVANSWGHNEEIMLPEFLADSDAKPKVVSKRDIPSGMISTVSRLLAIDEEDVLCFWHKDEYLVVSERICFDTDTGYERLPLPLFMIHVKSGEMWSLGSHEHNNDLLVCEIEASTAEFLVINDRYIDFIEGTRLSQGLHPCALVLPGLVSVAENWSDPNKLLFCADRKTTLVHIREGGEVIEAKSVSSPVKYTAAGELCGDRGVVWGDRRGMGELGHSGEFTELINKDACLAWGRTLGYGQGDLSVLTPLELLGLEHGAPEFDTYLSYSVIPLRNGCFVALQHGSVWAWDPDLNYVDGIEDPTINGPVWVWKSTLICAGQTGLVHASVSPDGIQPFGPVRENSDLWEARCVRELHAASFGQRDKGADGPHLPKILEFAAEDGERFLYRAWRDMAEGPIDSCFRLLEVGSNDDSVQLLDATTEQSPQEASKHYIRVIDGSLGFPVERRWYSREKCRFVAHRISMQEVDYWGLFRDDGFSPKLFFTPYLSGNAVVVHEGDGSVAFVRSYEL